MKQREISKYRIMRVVNLSKGPPTVEEICHISGLGRATVSPYLSELVKENRLTFYVDKDGKTKRYIQLDSHDPQPLQIHGREKRQLPRLLKLGLEVKPLSRKRGRPRTRLRSIDRQSMKIADNMWDLERYGSYVARSMDNAIHFKYDEESGEPKRMGFSIRGGIKGEQAKLMRKAIDEAKAHRERLQRLGKWKL